jgi:hypothetical protein
MGAPGKLRTHELSSLAQHLIVWQVRQIGVPQVGVSQIQLPTVRPQAVAPRDYPTGPRNLAGQSGDEHPLTESRYELNRVMTRRVWNADGQMACYRLRSSSLALPVLRVSLPSDDMVGRMKRLQTP